jgi:hypothetical protein
VASRFPLKAPVRRAARWDGWFPIGLEEPDDLTDLLRYALEQRTTDAAFDVAVQGLPGADPRPWVERGATWWLVRFDPFAVTRDAVRAVIDAGPPGI